MAICCTVCGEWSPALGSDHLSICPDCYLANFAGAQPPLPDGDAVPREVLEAYVDVAGAYTLTPRQRAAMAHLQAQWRRSMEDDL